MIKKGVLIIVIVSIFRILVSCCKEEITFDSAEFNAVKSDSDWQIVDTFNTKVVFRIYLYQKKYSLLKTLEYKNLHATSCGLDVKNSMDISTIELRADRQIIIDNDTIKPNENLWTSALFKPYLSLYECDANREFVWFLKIKDEGIKKMKFEESKYLFSFRVRMTNSKIISDTTSVFIRI